MLQHTSQQLKSLQTYQPQQQVISSIPTPRKFSFGYPSASTNAAKLKNNQQISNVTSIESTNLGNYFVSLKNRKNIYFLFL